MGGGDKCLLPVRGRPILAHILERLTPQCDGLVLNANGDPARFSAFGLPVVADDVPGFAGPLAGLLAAMDWASEKSTATDLLAVPGDTPFLPADLATRLIAARDAAGATIVCASSHRRLHPTVGLWHLSLRAELEHALAEGERSIGRFARRLPLVIAEWDEEPDPFLNVNEPGDLEAAEGSRDANPSPL
jgi:molybdopterin-guanine dinucleotide biosynthesis protein A